MKKRRLRAAGALAKGLTVAILATLVGMLLMAAAVIFLGMGDTLIRVLNQVLKISAVALGAALTVHRGGERGLMTGAGVGALYALIGYLLYMFLGGYDFALAEFTGEVMLGMATGAVTGAVCANMKPAAAHK